MNKGKKYLFEFECNKCKTIKLTEMTVFDINSFLSDILNIGWFTQCSNCMNGMHSYVSHSEVSE
jgi:hypothetical protein